MIFKKNTQESVRRWHKIFMPFTNTQEKNKRLTPVKKSSLVHALFIFLKYQKKGVAALEIALILPILLILIMGIIEFSLIFSIRSGIEHILRETEKINVSILGSVFVGNAGSTSGLLHKGLVNILPHPENTTVCTSVHPNLSGTGGLLLQNSFPNCVTYSANRNTKPAVLDMGDLGDYVAIRITYRHQYLTPLAGLIKTIGHDLTFTSVAYFKRES